MGGLRSFRNDSRANQPRAFRLAATELLDGAARRRLVSVLPQVRGVANDGMNRWQHSCGAWLVVTGLVLALTACAGVPAQEMSDARQAIRAARAAGAQKAAPATLADAEDRLRRAEESLRQRDFREARRAAEQAGARAREALVAASSQPIGGAPSAPVQLPAPLLPPSTPSTASSPR